MSATVAEQDQIQAEIDQAAPEQRKRMRPMAEAVLERYSELARYRVLSPEENKESDLSIETLVRLEATAAGKGGWFRTKRRFQLVQKYYRPGR